MSSFPCISLILPSYNEAHRIAQTINQAQAYFEERLYPYEIIAAKVAR